MIIKMKDKQEAEPAWSSQTAFLDVSEHSKKCCIITNCTPETPSLCQVQQGQMQKREPWY